MIPYDITTLDFKRKCDEGDIVCLLAQMLAQDMFGKRFDLRYKKPIVILQFMQKAEELIIKLNEYDLQIVRKDNL